MKSKIWRIAALILLVLATSLAGADTKDEINKIGRAYDTALLMKDKKFLEKLYDDNGSYIDEKGRKLTKKQYIDLSLGSTMKVTSASGVQTSFRQFGDTVVESGTYTITGSEKSKPFRTILRYTDVWVKKDGTWIIVAEQCTTVPNKK